VALFAVGPTGSKAAAASATKQAQAGRAEDSVRFPVGFRLERLGGGAPPSPSSTNPIPASTSVSGIGLNSGFRSATLDDRCSPSRNCQCAVLTVYLCPQARSVLRPAGNGCSGTLGAGSRFGARCAANRCCQTRNRVVPPRPFSSGLTIQYPQGSMPGPARFALPRHPHRQPARRRRRIRRSFNWLFAARGTAASSSCASKTRTPEPLRPGRDGVGGEEHSSRRMRWLGLDWDEGPGNRRARTSRTFQSQRGKLHPSG
jgi:hypothetical protein